MATYVLNAAKNIMDSHLSKLVSITTDTYCGGIEWMCRRSARSSGQVGRDSVRLRAL